jgi:hypothetical protein
MSSVPAVVTPLLVWLDMSISLGISIDHAKNPLPVIAVHLF